MGKSVESESQLVRVFVSHINFQKKTYNALNVDREVETSV